MAALAINRACPIADIGNPWPLGHWQGASLPYGRMAFKIERGAYIEPRMINDSGKLKPRWANQTDNGQNRLSPSENRWIDRSRTYPGIADSIALEIHKLLTV